MNQPNSQILLSLIQGDEGKAWAADKNGWKEQHEDGEPRCGGYEENCGLEVIERQKSSFSDVMKICTQGRQTIA